MGKNGRLYAEENHSYHLAAKKFDAVLKNIIATRSLFSCLIDHSILKKWIALPARCRLTMSGWGKMVNPPVMSAAAHAGRYMLHPEHRLLLGTIGLTALSRLVRKPSKCTKQTKGIISGKIDFNQSSK